ncbi:MAG: hypothetical protein ABR591_03580 [Candidatus Velthaea sp.]
MSRSVGLTFSGIATLASGRRTLDAAPVHVTVTMNGAVVGSGPIDANGKGKIALTGVPAGSTIVVTAGIISVTVVLATTANATAVLVSANPDGTLSVKAAADPNNTGSVTPDEDEQQDAIEDGHGNVTTVNNAAVLPANLPFNLANACGTITLTPANSAAASVRFEEKNSDDANDHGDARVRYEGPFTQALTFPVLGNESRIHVIVFDAAHKQLVEVKAPLAAFTSGSVKPAACPSTSPSPAPSASASAAAQTSPSPAASASAAPSPVASASASPAP